MSPQSKQELSKVKSLVGNVESPRSKAEKQKIKTLKHLEKVFYDQLKDDQRISVDGTTNKHLRFDRIYSSNKEQNDLNELEIAELNKRKKLEQELL